MEFWVSGLLGQVIDEYHIESYLGDGNFSLVFEVSEVATAKRFAMKVLGPWSDAAANSDFHNEGRLLQTLSPCSHIITWAGSGTATVRIDRGGLTTPLTVSYHIMTLAEGTLEELVLNPARRASLSWGDKLQLWRDVIIGVHQMHLHRIAHRDLKSSNCLVITRSGQTEIRLADLGRSKVFNAPQLSLPMTYATGCGDTWFAPPEHLWFQGGSAEADFRNADLYGIGSVFVELATGHPMTALAIGSAHDASGRRTNCANDYANNKTNDLAVLRPRFHETIEHVAACLPRGIRSQAASLLRQLCDPVPTERLPGNDAVRKAPDVTLRWLLDRADHLIRDSKVDQHRRNARQTLRVRQS